MSLIKINISITLLMLYFIVHAFGKPQRPLPFPHLMEFELSDIGKPVHVFEGIDYDQLSGDLKKEYHDCYSEQYKCIRSRTQHSPVCGYDLRNKRFHRYFSQCELDLHNCNLMVEHGRVLYGTNLKDRIIFFMGEGYVCEIYARSSNVTTEFPSNE